MRFIFLVRSKIKGWHVAVSCAASTVWPKPAGPFLLTMASLGKEWPSFLWTRCCVRSPGSGRPFHFMVHRPCTRLCRAFRCRRGNVSWNWCPCQGCAALPTFTEHVTSLIGELAFQYEDLPAHVPRSPALVPNEELRMLQRRHSPGLICISWMGMKPFNVKAKLVNSSGVNILTTCTQPSPKCICAKTSKWIN